MQVQKGDILFVLQAKHTPPSINGKKTSAENENECPKTRRGRLSPRPPQPWGVDEEPRSARNRKSRREQAGQPMTGPAGAGCR